MEQWAQASISHENGQVPVQPGLEPGSRGKFQLVHSIESLHMLTSTLLDLGTWLHTFTEIKNLIARLPILFINLIEETALGLLETH